MKRPKVNTADTSDLTDKDWKELELTGVVIKGDRIIRTLGFIKRSEAGVREHIKHTAKRLFQ